MKKIKIIVIVLVFLIGGAYAIDAYLYELYAFYFKLRHENPVKYNIVQIKYDGLIIYKIHPYKLQFYPVGAESLGSVYFTFNIVFANNVKKNISCSDKYELLEEKQESLFGYPCLAVYAHEKESGWLVVARSIEKLGLTVVYLGQQESYASWMKFLENVKVIDEEPIHNQPPPDTLHPQTNLG